MSVELGDNATYLVKGLGSVTGDKFQRYPHKGVLLLLA
jgi:hypothetical protein